MSEAEKDEKTAVKALTVKELSESLQTKAGKFFVTNVVGVEVDRDTESVKIVLATPAPATPPK